MKFVRNYFCLLLLLVIGTAQSQDIEYVSYDTEDGISSNTVYKIVQDSTGLKWLGTVDGLVLFDGELAERLKVLNYNDPNLENSIVVEDLYLEGKPAGDKDNN